MAIPDPWVGIRRGSGGCTEHKKRGAAGVSQLAPRDVPGPEAGYFFFFAAFFFVPFFFAAFFLAAM